MCNTTPLASKSQVRIPVVSLGCLWLIKVYSIFAVEYQPEAFENHAKKFRLVHLRLFILPQNPVCQKVLLRNYLHCNVEAYTLPYMYYYNLLILIDKILLPHYFLILLTLVALFGLKQMIYRKNKFAFHHVYLWS